MPELERLMLHRLAELDEVVRAGYDAFDFKRIAKHAARLHGRRPVGLLFRHPQGRALLRRAVQPRSRKAAIVHGGAPSVRLPGDLAGADAALHHGRGLARAPALGAQSVHLEQFPDVPAAWRDEALAEKWRKVRAVRRVVTGALEIERAKKTIGSSLEAAPFVHVTDPELLRALDGVDFAEICITSGIDDHAARPRRTPSRWTTSRGVAVVVPGLAEAGTKCARSWRYTDDVGSDPDFPDVSARDAAALRELQALGRLCRPCDGAAAGDRRCP